MVRWETLSESENARFILERSSNGFAFDFISEVLGAGTTGESQVYEFQDFEVLGGLYYYRLWQEDFDGTRELIGLTPAFFENKLPDVKVFPNPATKEAFVSIPEGRDEVLSMNLIDARGNQIAMVNEGNPELVRINLDGLGPGIYILELRLKNSGYLRKRLIIE